MPDYVGTVVLPYTDQSTDGRQERVFDLHAGGVLNEWWGAQQRSIANILGGTHTYSMTKTFLARVSNPYIVAKHPKAGEIAEAAGFVLEDLCRVVYPNISGIEVDRQNIIGAWSAKPEPDPRDRFREEYFDPLRAVSRKAFVRKPFEYDGVVYAGFEFKGVGLNGGPIHPERSRIIYSGDLFSNKKKYDSGPLGGMYEWEGEIEVNASNALWYSGKKNPLSVALFELPIYHKGPVNEGALGIVVRAVQSSVRASQMHEKLGEILDNIFCPAWRIPYREKFLKEFEMLEGAGMKQVSLHEGNVDATGSITDLGDTVPAEQMGHENLEPDETRAHRVSGLLLDPDFKKRRDRKALDLVHRLYPHSPKFRYHCNSFLEDDGVLAIC